MYRQAFNEIIDANFCDHDKSLYWQFWQLYSEQVIDNRNWAYEAIPSRILMRLEPLEEIELVIWAVYTKFDMHFIDMYFENKVRFAEWYKMNLPNHPLK